MRPPALTDLQRCAPAAFGASVWHAWGGVREAVAARPAAATNYLPSGLSLPPPLRARRLRAFTLIEVLVAITIFATCMAAILTVFQSASRSFQAGRRATVNLQTLRFTADQIARDLRSVYYETDYNKAFTDMQANMAQDTGAAALMRLKSDQTGEGAAQDLEPGYIGRKLELHFLGQGAEKQTVLEFAHYVMTTGGPDQAPWGAERVRYFLGGVNGTDLYRQRGPVDRVVIINPNLEAEVARAKAEAAANGTPLGAAPGAVAGGGLDPSNPLAGFNFNLIAKRGTLPPQYQPANPVQYLIVEEPTSVPPPELLAQGIEKLEISYGKFDGQWSEVGSWDSDSKDNRTPAFDVPPTDPQFFEKLTQYQVRPSDHLPAYVRLHLGIRESDPERQGSKRVTRVRTFDTFVWLPGALEVYSTSDNDTFSASATPTPQGR